MNRYFSIIPKLKGLLFYSGRAFSSKIPKEINYYGFTYYPRNADFKDPPYNPSKLFLVTRIKPVFGVNSQEKKILMKLNLDGPRKIFGHVAIVKNIPEVNALLWTIKHLVEIKPITWKGELPKDCSGTYLRQTGELVISPKLKVSKDVLENSNKLHNDPKLGKKYLKKYLLARWQEGHYCGV